MYVIDIIWRPVGQDQFAPGIASWPDHGESPVFFPLSAGSHVSWAIDGPKKCIGSRDPTGAHIRCPEQSIVSANRQRCGPCSATDQMGPCIRCRGTACDASESRISRCQNSEYAVYLAVFKDRTLKVGVSTLSRVKIRWLEQGADFAGVVSTTHGGMSARKIEDYLGHMTGITKQVRGERKASGLVQQLDIEQAHSIAKEFLASNNMTSSDSSFTLEDLSGYYGLSDVDTQPRPWRFSLALRSCQHLVGDVVGVKGSLLVTRTGSAFMATNLKQLIGYSVSVDPQAMMIAQTGLLDFL